jgi:hypothetical protein
MCTAENLVLAGTSMEICTADSQNIIIIIIIIIM